MNIFVTAAIKTHILGSHVHKFSCRLENCRAYICAACNSTPNRICLTLYDATEVFLLAHTGALQVRLLLLLL